MVPDVRKTETKKTYAAFGGGTTILPLQYCQKVEAETECVSSLELNSNLRTIE